MASPVAAIDIGGTKTLIEVYESGQREPAGSEESPTPGSGELVRDLAESVRRVAGGQDVEAVAVGCPGPLDPLGGVILNPPNLSREWWGLRLADGLAGELGAPAALENDCNLGALGEWDHGSGKGYDSVLYVTVSTGVGAGLVSGGEIFGGNRGFALELGHTVLETGGPVCGCGRAGCVEALTSGPAIARRALELGWTPDPGETDSRAVAYAAERGHPVAHRALEEAASYLGKALVNFIYSFDPGVVVLGGGVTRSDLFVSLARDAVGREPVMEAFLGVPVVRAGQPGRSVIHGARTLAERTSRNSSRPTGTGR
ncbi:ROK family protein [Rubrobacter aplysinae]|uniref:ROK family protein n=1 Tax=Rubrobacter aplysinae TaxID=909625 RepID=UPI00069CCE9C|nr:ROK family protein [Rubrobacter aplysinae]